MLDSHALLWWWSDEGNLSLAANRAILNPDNPVYVSAASGWEILTKSRSGRLGPLARNAEEFQELLSADGFHSLSVTLMHGLRAGSYAMNHRDPFDRMLAAQAEMEGLTLVTRDLAFADFPVQTLW